MATDDRAIKFYDEEKSLLADEWALSQLCQVLEPLAVYPFVLDLLFEFQPPTV
jgi:hypothetical protein